jgi:catechol 2,3-dioxygenase-like lactoylglutathione lyase family enzyme
LLVRDLEAAISFFTDLGLTVLGRDTVRGEWTDIAVGLDGNHANIAMLQTPGGNGRLELFEYIHPDPIETDPPDRTRSACTASPSLWTTSTWPSRSPQRMAATQSWCVQRTARGSPQRPILRPAP